MSSRRSTERVEAGRIVWTISRRLGMVIVLALAFVMSAVVTIYLLFRIGDTRVPNLVGKPEVDAQKMAEKAGFKIKVQRRNDPSVPANTVIETRPVPNSSVKKDSVLTLVISSGPVQLKSQARSTEGACGTDQAMARLSLPDHIRQWLLFYRAD